MSRISPASIDRGGDCTTFFNISCWTSICTISGNRICENNPPKISLSKKNILRGDLMQCQVFSCTLSGFDMLYFRNLGPLCALHENVSDIECGPPKFFVTHGAPEAQLQVSPTTVSKTSQPPLLITDTRTPYNVLYTIQPNYDTVLLLDILAHKHPDHDITESVSEQHLAKKKVQHMQKAKLATRCFMQWNRLRVKFATSTICENAYGHLCV